MNVVLLYGNGFDQALGLETSYESFLVWADGNHKKNFTPAAVEFLDIVKGYAGNKLWGNFETALGLCQYDRMSSCEGFDSFGYASNTVFAVQELMRSFLMDKSRKLHEWVITDLIGGKFIEGLNRLCLENGVGVDFSVDKLQIASLNYTNTLETILRNDVVFHPHGTLEFNNPLILGVDSNKQLKHLNCGEFARLLCKRSQIEENTISGENRDDKLMRMLNGADVVILFGLSFAPSDYRIWRTVSRRAATCGAKIVLCQHDGDEVERFKQGMCQWGLEEKQVDEDQQRLWQSVSERIILAKDSKNDFLGLNSIQAMLNSSAND